MPKVNACCTARRRRRNESKPPPVSPGKSSSFEMEAISNGVVSIELVLGLP